MERVRIDINIEPRNPPDGRDLSQWLRLFRLFDGAQELEFGTEFIPYEELDTAKIGQEVLPALRILRLSTGRRVPRVIKSFITERELTGRPITVIHRWGHVESGPESA